MNLTGISRVLVMPLFIFVASCFLLFCRVAPTFSDSNSELYGPTSFVIPIKSQVCFAHTKEGSIISRIKVSPAILPPSTLYINRGSYSHLIIIALLLTISGDIEVNPGPIRFPCGKCNRAVRSNQRGICCDQCDRWFHIRCSNISNDDYTLLSNNSETWVCLSCTSLTEHGQSQQHLQEPERLPCSRCNRAVRSNQRGICCDQCNRWFHIRCSNISTEDYTLLSSNSETWVCLSCTSLTEQGQSQQHLQEPESENEHSRFPCGHCCRLVADHHRGICCDQCNRWFHIRCANITYPEYTRLSNNSESWICIVCHTHVNEQYTTTTQIEPEREHTALCHISTQRPANCEPNNQLSQHQYLHLEGWQTVVLHKQSWAQKFMHQFQTKQIQWQNKKCNICNEQWPTRTHLDMDPYICNRCQRDKHFPKLYSAGNDMDPGNVPPCLQGMTQIEELLIARACPIMTIYHKHGGQLGYTGHVLNLPQNIQHFIDKLPVNVSDLPILTVVRQGAANTHHSFRVRRDKVLNALQWLKQHNRFYQDIEIDLDSIQNLPVDGIPDTLLNFEIQNNDS